MLSRKLKSIILPELALRILILPQKCAKKSKRKGKRKKKVEKIAERKANR